MRACQPAGRGRTQRGTRAAFPDPALLPGTVVRRVRPRHPGVEAHAPAAAKDAVVPLHQRGERRPRRLIESPHGVRRIDHEAQPNQPPGRLDLARPEGLDPSLLTRRYPHRVQRRPDQFVTWDDRHPVVRSGPPGRGSRSAGWLPRWLPLTASLSGMLADRLHLHKSRPERIPGCLRVTVTVPDRPSHRARGGHSRHARLGWSPSRDDSDSGLRARPTYISRPAVAPAPPRPRRGCQIIAVPAVPVAQSRGRPRRLRPDRKSVV